MQRVEPKQFITDHKPLQVSVWAAPDDVMVVENPVIAGDSLAGVLFGVRWGIPLKRVVRVEATAPDIRRTLLLLAGVAASAVGVYVINGKGNKGGGTPPCPPGGCDGLNGPPD